VEAEMELLKQTQGEMMARNMMKGKDDANTDKLDLATLLNVLDGVRETPGRIIVLSTNYPERLDEALLRPGRFDMMLEFEKHSCAVLKQHLEKHYDIVLTPEQELIVMSASLEKKWTPAEVSQILFRRITDLNKAIEDLYTEDPVKLFKFSQQQSQQQQGQAQSTDLAELLKDVAEKEVVENVTIAVEAAVEAAVIVEETLEETTEESVTTKPLDAKEVFKDCTFSEQSILFGIHADMGLLSANDIGIPSVKHASEYPQIELASHTTILQGQVDQVDTFKLTQEQLGSIPAEFFGIAAFNEGPETSLDDFFPDLE
jgi:SpoVK/Ycf46/Vps4 family AAA+-type ATPase